jgi:hypothetical protein
MKLKLITAIAFGAMAIISCDEDTATIGASLTSENDKLVVSTHNFDVLTRSIAVDSIYSRERQCYFGMVRDPETDTYVKSEFTTQFNMMENTISDLPAKKDMLSLDADGNIVADSCVVYIFLDMNASYGDSLTSMKLRITELERPIESSLAHYTNFDPKEYGYLRQGGLRYDQMFTLRDLTQSDSVRYLTETNLHRSAATADNSYYDVLQIWLNNPYTDKNGVTYDGYGTYILRNVYDHPEYFKNSYNYIHNICPGLHFETIDGVGVMAKVQQIDLYTYYHYNYDGEVRYSYLRTASTEEVLQTSKITNDKNAISQLVEDNSCTYLKSPAGIFTEVTFPVDEISTSHPNDSLLSAKVYFQRENNTTEASQLAFSVPSKLLLIEKDSLDSFFRGNNLYNNVYAYEVSLASNAYTFNNISNLITRMHEAKVKGLKSDPNWVANHPNWNKALLVPIEEVTVTTSSSSYSYYYGYTNTSSQTPVALKNQMGLSSTRLVKGTASNPIKMEVIYAKFKD